MHVTVSGRPAHRVVRPRRVDLMYRYANRAKNIKNKPTVNEDPKDAMLRSLQEVCGAARAGLGAVGPTRRGAGTRCAQATARCEARRAAHGPKRCADGGRSADRRGEGDHSSHGGSCCVGADARSQIVENIVETHTGIDEAVLAQLDQYSKEERERLLAMTEAERHAALEEKARAAKRRAARHGLRAGENRC